MLPDRATYLTPSSTALCKRWLVAILGLILPRHALIEPLVFTRDVKSSNILLTRDNAAKVADVGLATMTDYFSSSSNTHGTFLYAAPEVLMGRPSTAKVVSQKKNRLHLPFWIKSAK